MSSLIFLIITVSLASCHHDIIYTTPITPNNCNFGLCDTSKWQIVWQQPLSTDTAEWISVPPLVFNDNILFTRSTFYAQPDTLKIFNRKNGSLIATWADYGNWRQNGIAGSEMVLNDNKYFLTTGDNVAAIDAQSNQTVWKTHIENGTGGNEITSQYDCVYHSRDGLNIYDSPSYLVRAKNTLGQWDTIFSQGKVGNYNPFIARPKIWISPIKDTVALFQIRYADFVTGRTKNRMDYVAYNITQRETYFRFDSLDNDGSGQIALIDNNRAYLPTNTQVYCFDLLAKKLIWTQDLKGAFNSNNPLIMVNGVLYVKPANTTYFFALDPQTGNVLWSDGNAGMGSTGIAYNNGIIYYAAEGSGTIIAYDINSHKKVWDEPSPNKYKNKFNGNRTFSNANIGYGGLYIDPVNGYLYASDFYFAMCLKLPK